MNIETPYQQVTRDLLVKAAPFYDSERSLPDQNVFVFMYAIEIENQGSETVQLISRNWTIRNGRGEEQVVSGAGVVGEQPILRPGDRFHYVSQCPLDTPTGSMRGHYTFQDQKAQAFEVTIPLFFLRPQDTLDSLSQIYHPIQ